MSPYIVTVSVAAEPSLPNSVVPLTIKLASPAAPVSPEGGFTEASFWIITSAGKPIWIVAPSVIPGFNCYAGVVYTVVSSENTSISPAVPDIVTYCLYNQIYVYYEQGIHLYHH